MYTNRQNFSICWEIEVEELHGDVRFRPEVHVGRWPFRACTMKIMQYNAYLCPNCGNFHVDLSMGQIPRSTEHISSF